VESSPGIPLLWLGLISGPRTAAAVLLYLPPTWLVRQAVPIDVTRLDFIHKIFFFLMLHPVSPTLSLFVDPTNQLQCSALLKEQKLWNEFAVYGAPSLQGRRPGPGPGPGPETGDQDRDRDTCVIPNSKEKKPSQTGMLFVKYYRSMMDCFPSCWSFMKSWNE